MKSIEEIKELHKEKTLDMLYTNNKCEKVMLRGEVNLLNQIIEA